MNQYVITIGRQFGSGGRSIAEKLAKKLDIKFYDKELISIAAKESGISPEVFEGVDEKATNSLLYSLSMGMYSFGSGFPAMGDLPVNDKLYLLQHKIIKEIAEKENCVIVGRCADYVLRDNPKRVSIFIYADMEFRKEQSIKKHGIDPAHAEHIINKTDKNRANYYSFYSGQKWGQAENFDLCIDSSKLDEDKIVELIAEYIKMR
ncbi:cytidylate kinase-like family protein [Ruminococcus sp.]|uniref:cytidylate kinase-like family protein n=1 Tax=Ruminococcus sp. TaxID=41978 RepID=UPI002E80A674|nr:cytidylate kinase-like family protein [Ruminococcus sp.]MEE3493065.1 cytidylate kinase-like family protein [Ruminococcus sp.]